jgi:hypothetical protein
MARRNASSQAEHDRVIEAWAQVVVRRFSGEFQVSTNPGNHRRTQVGRADDPRFPDVLIWRSDRADGRDGTAELVAEVETSDTLQEDEVAQWATYGSLPAPFHLVVPAGSEPEAIRLVKKKAVRVSQLWSYTIVGGEVIFSQFLELPALEDTRVVQLE